MRLAVHGPCNRSFGINGGVWEILKLILRTYDNSYQRLFYGWSMVGQLAQQLVLSYSRFWVRLDQRLFWADGCTLNRFSRMVSVGGWPMVGSVCLLDYGWLTAARNIMVNHDTTLGRKATVAWNQLYLLRNRLLSLSPIFNPIPIPNRILASTSISHIPELSPNASALSVRVCCRDRDYVLSEWSCRRIGFVSIESLKVRLMQCRCTGL